VTRREAWCLIALAGLGACSEPAIRPPPARASADHEATARARFEPFRFASPFWLNLHLDLYAEAAGGEASGAGDPGWRGAVAHYRETWAGKSLFDPALVEVTNALRADVLAGVDRGHEAVLRAAEPGYRERVWPARQRCVRRFLEGLEPLVLRHGGALARRLGEVYRSPWPAEPMSLDVTGYAGRHGAYSTLGPVRLTMACDHPLHPGPLALEIAFHEASHALVRPLRDVLEGALAARGAPAGDAWHVMLFYLTGEIVRAELGAGYVPYAEIHRLYAEGPWRAYQRALAQPLARYLAGDVGADEALGAAAAALR
jgi:hypothetical protein